jgi:hypothetical protein
VPVLEHALAGGNVFQLFTEGYEVLPATDGVGDWERPATRRLNYPFFTQLAHTFALAETIIYPYTIGLEFSIIKCSKRARKKHNLGGEETSFRLSSSPKPPNDDKKPKHNNEEDYVPKPPAPLTFCHVVHSPESA